MIIEVYTDGSATTADKPGGWGFVLVVDDKKIDEGNGSMPGASNNDAELQAAIEGLGRAYQYLMHEAPSMQLGDLEIFLVSDSQLVLGWADGTYNFKQATKMDKYNTLQELVRRMRIKTRWIQGHNGDEHNERCDALANEARLSLVKKTEKMEAIVNNKTLIGTKKTGTVCLWYKDGLKVIDLDNNIVENYNRTIHGARGSMLEIREEKSR